LYEQTHGFVVIGEWLSVKGPMPNTPRKKSKTDTPFIKSESWGVSVDGNALPRRTISMDEAQSRPVDGATPPARRAVLRSDVRNALVCVLAAGLVWLGYHVHLARRQGAAVAAIRGVGGKVTYAHQLPFASQPWAPKWLRRSLGDDCFIQVVGVNLARTNVADHDLAPLAQIGQLRFISLDETAVGNAGLKYLAGLRHLEELRLRHTAVTDSGLECIGKATALRMVDLEGTQVSDQGLMRLAGLPALMQVHLVDTHVTEQGVRRFKTETPTAAVVVTESRFRRGGRRR
jgi:hypothetical protein